MAKIRTKFILIFLVSIFFLGISGFYAVFFVDKLSSAINETTTLKDAAQNVLLRSEEFNNIIGSYSTNDAEKMKILGSKFEFSMIGFRDSIGILEKNKNLRNYASAISDIGEKYKTISKNVIDIENERLKKESDFNATLENIKTMRRWILDATSKSPEKLRLEISEMEREEEEFNFRYQDKERAQTWIDAIKSAEKNLQGNESRAILSLLEDYSALAEKDITEKNDLIDLNANRQYYISQLEDVLVESKAINSRIAKDMDDKLNAILDESGSQSKAIFGFMLLIFTISVFFIMNASKNISDSIKNLANVSQKILNGKLDERVKIGSNDEIGRMASVFNKMLDGINAKNTRLKEESGQMKAIISSMEEGLLVLDINLNVTLMNKTAAKILGVSSQKTLGKNIAKTVKIMKNDTELKMEEWPIQKTLKTGKSVITDIKDGIIFKTFSGKTFPIEMVTAPLERNGVDGIIIVFKDVTEKKLIEEEREFSRRNLENVLKSVYIERDNVQEEKNKLGAILNSIGDAVLAIDRDKRVMIFNPVAEKITGFEFEEMENDFYEKYLRFVDEVTKEKKTEAINMALSGKIEKMSNGTALITKDNNFILVEISAAPIRNDKREIIGCIVVFRDVTENREVERMRSDFISIVSHQLRTPLSAMKWFLEILINGDVGTMKSKQREILKEVSINNKNMIDFVNQMLNISRIESNRLAINPETVYLDKTVKDIIKEVEPFIMEKKQILKFKGLEDESFKIKTDRNLLRNVINSLLINASRYTPDGGKISLEIERKGKKNLLFKVKDNGIGIPEKEQYKIFKKFSRANNAIKYEASGTGIGLYIVKSIIDMIGAKVWFESKEGSGTTFFFTLPIENILCELKQAPDDKIKTAKFRTR